MQGQRGMRQSQSDWTDLTNEFGTACDLGRRFLDREGRRAAVSEVFFGKATATLEKRSRALREYVAYARASHFEPAPVTIDNVLVYLRSLQSEGTPLRGPSVSRRPSGSRSGTSTCRGPRKSSSVGRSVGWSSACSPTRASVGRPHPLRSCSW